MSENHEKTMPFTAHLAELRRCLIISFSAVGVGFAAAYAFSGEILEWLVRPLIQVLPPGNKLVFTALPEAFFIYLKVSLITGIVVASPVIFYQLWMFVAPGLYQKEKRLVLPFVFVSTALFVGGALFGYYVVFPVGFRFLVGFSTDNIKALPSIQMYLTFCLKLLLGFGLVFEFPVVAFFLAKVGIIDAPMMARNRRVAILLIFIVAAIVTPPDIVSQILLAIPLYLLYEASIVLVRITVRKREKKARAEQG
ncbi:MAG: twin-arginine translocase subunit TatC [Desulfobacterota bacterium]|jgi:sec-independent protein translocase protein TatC|nr:twin-arginine translocase subunit TatC [Thermodesulfobacteriota bacterium]